MAFHVMLDFETLSLKPDAVLLSIGACTFDTETGEVGNEFYLAIDPRTQHQRHIDADTVLWWLKQDEAARTKLTSAIEAREKLDEDGDFTDEQLTELMEQAAHPIHHVARAMVHGGRGCRPFRRKALVLRGRHDDAKASLCRLPDDDIASQSCDPGCSWQGDHIPW